MGGLEGRLNALIEASAQGERAESTSGRSGSLPPFRLSSEAELSAARSRSAVRHGENSGRMLPHKDVVREMILLGQWRGEAAIFPVPASEPEIAEAAIVQAAESGPILVAAKR